MKKVTIIMMGLFLTMGFSIDANAWGYTKSTVKCKATNTFSIGIDSTSMSFSEEWEGTKDVCKSGNDWWCWSTNCS